MAKSPDNFADFIARLEVSGLVCFGGLEITATECAQGSEALIGLKGLLIGNVGKDMWHVFSKSNEFADGKLDPMNRWTKRILDEIASELGARVVYPFDEPYWPFQRLAQKAAVSRSSPLGILIHPHYGLWHAFRGLFIFDDAHELSSQINQLIPSSEDLIHPCETCSDKPCLTACPVGAFTGERLEVKTCFTHLDSGNDPDCMQSGCQARLACPIAKDHQYVDAQMKFHMKSYRGL